MSTNTFRALRIEPEGERYVRRIRERRLEDLPSGDVLVRVHWSALNFKDGLSATGNKAVTRDYPHTPGIDAAGVVAASDSPDWRPGDPVIVTSYDLGMNTDGGFGEYIRVPADWVVPMPEGMDAREAMIFGTAGFTAALCIRELRLREVLPESGDVLVTGATGGVGSLAVALLSRLGYQAHAATGKADAEGWLRGLGAAAVVDRGELADDSGRPLLKPRWAGAVDTVGGDVLAHVLKCIDYRGAASCCGLVASPQLNTTVFPFILRHVALMGVDSQNTPAAMRRDVWSDLAGGWKPGALDAIAVETDLDGLDAEIDRILAGGVRGRVIVRMAEAQ